MKYAASNYLGQTSARSYQDEKLICVNLDTFFAFPEEIRRFIVLHEKGHIVKNTDSEIEADNYAFSRMSGTFKGSNRWSVLSLSRVLPFTNKEQYLRLLNMYQNAIAKENSFPRDHYEESGAMAYEFQNIQTMKNEAAQLPEEMFQGQKKANQTDTPIGPYVEIAHGVWTKKALGLELTGYDISILDKYPMPADFECYQVDGSEIIGAENVDLSETASKLAGTAKSWYASLSPNALLLLWSIVVIVFISIVSRNTKQ